MTRKTAETKLESQLPEGVERTAPRIVFRPRVDIVEREETILLIADIPGTHEGATDVTLEKNVLTIRAAVQPQRLEGYRLAYEEYDVGNFERAFTLSGEIDREGIEAVVKDGVLRVTLPKAKGGTSKKIVVHAG